MWLCDWISLCVCLAMGWHSVQNISWPMTPEISSRSSSANFRLVKQTPLKFHFAIRAFLANVLLTCFYNFLLCLGFHTQHIQWRVNHFIQKKSLLDHNLNLYFYTMNWRISDISNTLWSLKQHLFTRYYFLQFLFLIVQNYT